MYQQAYCTIKAIIEEINSNKAEYFAKIPAYLKQFVNVDKEN